MQFQSDLFRAGVFRSGCEVFQHFFFFFLLKMILIAESDAKLVITFSPYSVSTYKMCFCGEILNMFILIP